MLLPHSGYYLRGLADGASAYSVIENPYRSAEDRAAGQDLFKARCTVCHGLEGDGGTAPRLADAKFKMGDSDWAIYRTITGSTPGLTMPAVPLPERETWQIIAYLRELRMTEVAQVAPRAPHPTLPGIDVTAERIRASDSEPESWLTYSGSYASRRYSGLNEVRAENVAELKLAWSLQIETSESVEASPLVVDGVMFLTEPPSDVVALDAATGEQLWKYTRRIASDVRVCCGQVNRGVALLGKRVFVGTLDGHLVALDARTGRVDWEAVVADHAEGYSITAAPLALDDLVIVGVAGGEFGIRGFLDAYDASTGVLRWRFHTIPEPGKPGAETWQGDAWRTGGGPTWLTGAYDPELGLVYWGVGNPSPDFNGDSRPGDNLFTASVIALRASTGELAWHFQFNPHDEHDWDANQIPVLVDADYNGAPRRLMLWAHRNGFYYVLDRESGEFLHATPFVRQTWALGFDERGRPRPSDKATPSTRGTLIWPGVGGGANWMSPAFSPRTGLFYTSFAEAPSVYYKRDDQPEPRNGVPRLGSTSEPSGDPIVVGVRALNAITGERVWEHIGTQRRSVGKMGGVLATAGDIVFAADSNAFVALDARSGEQLWKTNLGGNIAANPVSFAVNGRQHVAIAAGNVLFVFRR
ncbi:MAG TPA: PQQ-dependent dehydrogenase, methanol/ethanol family [Gammaproteobacteria bacterium]|nr:PQQ-dependent dehydrogenase, methanol/ethanol family [Gammaproteobacteria bacterium]